MRLFVTQDASSHVCCKYQERNRKARTRRLVISFIIRNPGIFTPRKI
ncbi:MAG: hypothetical protein ACUVQV_03030 [Dissulfurimicrobium sp.]